jgi:alanine dehydrogenase
MVKSEPGEIAWYGKRDVEALLDPASCLAAVERGLRDPHQSDVSGVVGLPLPHGSFHAKVAIGGGGATGRRYLAAKLNMNLPGNPGSAGLPTIQGLLVLFDVATGSPLAVMDSASITVRRTAAASALAARELANADATTVAFIGCGAQAIDHLAALRQVRPIDAVLAFDQDRGAAERFARRAADETGIGVEITADLRSATSRSHVIVTLTPSMQPIVGLDDVRPGTFIAAVGADNETKVEIEPALMRAAIVVTDNRAQCSRIGDLRSAIAAGAMTLGDVRADLSEVLRDPVRGRHDASDIVIFDSTGLPLEDVAAAVLVHERGTIAGQRRRVDSPH